MFFFTGRIAIPFADMSKAIVAAAKQKNQEIVILRSKFPSKVPIIVQRFIHEKQIPQMNKSKFLVPQEITMSQFLTIIRHRLKLGPNQALYLLINNRSLLSLSLTLAEAYSEFAEPDGFLYISYASQEVFGGSTLS